MAQLNALPLPLPLKKKYFQIVQFFSGSAIGNTFLQTLFYVQKCRILKNLNNHSQIQVSMDYNYCIKFMLYLV